MCNIDESFYIDLYIISGIFHRESVIMVFTLKFLRRQHILIFSLSIRKVLLSIYIKFLYIVFCLRSTTLRSMRSFLKLGKQRPPRTRSCDSNSETRELLDRQDSSCPTSNEPSRTNSMTSLETNASDNDSQSNANAELGETVLKTARRSKPKVNMIVLDRIDTSCTLQYTARVVKKKNRVLEFYLV